MDIQHISKITEMVTDSMFCYSEHALVSQHLSKAPPNSIFQYMYAHEGKIIEDFNKNQEYNFIHVK